MSGVWNLGRRAARGPASRGVLGAHDVGGDPALRGRRMPIETEARAFALWERHVDAMEHLLSRNGHMGVDELRAGVEAMEPAEYRHALYYERWAHSLARAALAKGLVTERQLRERLAGDEAPTPGGAAAAARFAKGDAVRVRGENLRTRWRKPHLRTPGYIHGVPGTVALRVGEFRNPEEGAFQGIFGAEGMPRARAEDGKATLYRVRFRQADVWEHYDGSPDDTIDVEIYDHWLEPAPRGAAAPRPCVVEPPAHGHGHDHDHDHGHDHDHDHDHDDHKHEARADVERTAVEREPEAGEESALQLVARALREQLVENGVFTNEDVRRRVEEMDTKGERLEGRRLVARAWVDPEFRKLLTSNGSEAARVLGIDAAGTRLHVVENTDAVHNLVVCTLCSCYPRALLGMPPDWYKSRAYRARAVREPRAVLKDFGTDIPENVEVRVHDSTADLRYIVLPQRPAGTQGWSEDRLVEAVSRDAMMGVRQ